tara:strand:+ start:5222 stop:5386 length:165 start_codon:yes stop_codon:yes gene_type:complete
MEIEQLEDWAQRAVQELQDLCDEAQEAAGDPMGETELPGTRALIDEFNQINKAS